MNKRELGSSLKGKITANASQLRIPFLLVRMASPKQLIASRTILKISSDFHELRGRIENPSMRSIIYNRGSAPNRNSLI
jgi:hypothetical protein